MKKLIQNHAVLAVPENLNLPYHCYTNMNKPQLIGSDRFRQFHVQDQVPKATISEFEKRYEKFSQIPTIANGWLARSPSNSQSKSLTDAAYIIRAQKNLRQVDTSFFICFCFVQGYIKHKTTHPKKRHI